VGADADDVRPPDPGAIPLGGQVAPQKRVRNRQGCQASQAGVGRKGRDHVKGLPEPRRKSINEFLSFVSGTKDKELERVHKELPSGRVVVMTNADHHGFIERENEVVREMREFLVK
jgi:hypothetical protein